MDIRRIDENLSISTQISVEDIDRLASLGYRGVICNRPDGEGPGQPSFADIEQAARRRGLQAHYIPVFPGAATDRDAARFAEALRSTPGPVLAYCFSGNRSAALWSMARARSA